MKLFSSPIHQIGGHEPEQNLVANTETTASQAIAAKREKDTRARCRRKEWSVVSRF
jgi:hypothetical protein